MSNHAKSHPSPAKRLLFGCLSAAALLGVSLYAQTPDFGPNVHIFDPSMSGASINSVFDQISNPSTADSVQFGTQRAAVLFKPGNYTGVSHQVGFYTSVAGLGQTPDAVTLNGGGLYLDVTDGSGNVTTNFWRSIENLTVPVPAGGTERWAVAQGAAFRRMHITGDLELTNQSCGFASGGFISDSKVDGKVNECSQQQWYTRNSYFNSWVGYVWNYVFSGVQFGAGNTPANTFPNVTELATTPVSREKPFLYIDNGGAYNVFVPALKTNSSGISWAGGLGAGSTLPLSSFFIAKPSNTAADINAALKQGKNLILTPGIYQLGASLQINRAGTIVLGLGYPTLVPSSGVAAITTADVDGVEIAAVLIDAGATPSPVLLKVGTTNGTRANHAANPTTIFDTFFRIGGATPGSAATSLEVDSNNVILDNIWAWRADHGQGIGWNANTADHGVVVNGDNVTALGLAVEHYQKSQVLWNGKSGETIFYQSEDPYDVPSQSAWMDGTMKGYPSYEVAAGVCQHTAYGLGVYSFFNQNVDIHQSNAIVVPNITGIRLTDMVTVKLNGSGDIDNIVDNTGGPAPTGASPRDLVSYTGSGACTAPVSGGVAIDAGGGPVAPFVADEDFTGGSGLTTQHAIDLSGVTNPAPALVYQSTREGIFSYTVSNLAPGSAHTVRLHFSELYFSTAGSREFNVTVNGVPALTNFDVVKAAGGQLKATVQQVNTTADASGRVVISFTRGAADQPEVSGVEVQ